MVDASKRNPSSLDYLASTRDVQKWVMQKTINKPKRYSKFIEKYIEDPAVNCYSSAVAASYLENIDTVDNFRLKERYIELAICYLNKVNSQIGLLYEIYRKESIFTEGELKEIGNKVKLAFDNLRRAKHDNRKAAKAQNLKWW